VSFRFEPDRPVPEEARRVLSEQIRAGRDAIAGEPSASAVHETRKAIKRTRAVLALLRRGLATDQVDLLDDILREAARSIGPVRDADALEDLVSRMDLHVPVDEVPDRATRIATALAALDHAEQLAGGLEMIDVRPELLLRGLTRAFGRARNAYRTARQSRDALDVHEWRKATKRLLYQVELLEPLAPGLDGVARLVDELQHQLGDHHDLHVLHDVAAGDDAASTLLEKKANDLEDRAFAAGEVMFAAKPKAFERWVTAVLN
jgi:CHAD domain-containing protein